MGVVVEIPGIAAPTWRSGVAAEADLPTSGNSLYDARVSLADESIYFWTGSAWVAIGGGGGGGVTTVGAFSGSAQTNGASISSTTITFGPASNTVPGMVGTGAQTWAGVKTFASAPIVSALTASLPVVTDGSKALASVSYATFLASLGAAPTANPVFTGVAGFAAGAVGAPSVYFTGDATTGLYSTAAGTLDIAVSGVRQASFTANSFNPLATGGYTYQIALAGSIQGIRINNTASSSAYLELASGNFGYGFFCLNATDWKNKMRLTRLDGAFYSMFWGEQGQVYMGGNTTGQKGVSVNIQAQPDISNIGGTTTANAATTITGSSTSFLERVGVGDRISLSSAASTYATVTAIASNTSLTVDTALGDGTSQTINVKRGILQIYNAAAAASVGYINDLGKWTIGKSGTSELISLHGATEATGAGVATMTNAPAGAAGNPDVWVKIQYNGTTYVMPAWTP